MSSILPRFSYTLIVNLIKALLGFGIGGILAKGLGVNDFGRYSFLTAIFISSLSLLDMGSSNAFYTFISKSKQSLKFYSLYFLWLCIQFVFVVLLVYLIAPDDIINAIFIGESRAFVLMAFTAIFLQYQIWNVLAQIAESSRQTIKIQSLNLFAIVVQFSFVICLFLLEMLEIKSIFVVIIIEYLFIVVIFYKIIFTSNIISKRRSNLTTYQILQKIKLYCLPLVLFSWCGFLYRFFDTWLLQHFSGAEHQAYYAVGAQVAAISLIFTTSVLTI